MTAVLIVSLRRNASASSASAAEALAIARDREEGRERRQEPGTRLVRGLLVVRDVERPDEATFDLQPMRGATGRGAGVSEDDARGRDSEHGRGALRDALELVVELEAAKELARDVREQGRLALPLGGLVAPPASPGGQMADDDRRRQVDGEREPVAPVRQRERVDRRQEEEVEREHARDRDGHGERGPPDHGDREDGEDVEDAEAEDGDDAGEELDRGRHDRDCGDAGPRAGEHATRPSSIHEVVP